MVKEWLNIIGRVLVFNKLFTIFFIFNTAFLSRPIFPQKMDVVFFGESVLILSTAFLKVRTLWIFLEIKDPLGSIYLDRKLLQLT